MKLFLSTLALFATISAQASLLTFEKGSVQIDGININTTATVNDQNGNPSAIKMDLLGAGLRQKQVFIAKVKVYVAQMFADNKGAFSRDANALTSLVSSSKFVAMKLTMRRNLDAPTLSSSFKEAIAANNYAIDAELNQLLDIIKRSPDAGENQTIVMMMKREDNGQTSIYYEDVKGGLNSFTGSPELMTKIMSIWLGKPADGGLADLKKDLLKPVY